MKEKFCARCGKKFLTDKRSPYCSDFCRMNETRICEICHKQFISRYNSPGTTCSKECGLEKKKRTVRNKFGVDNISQNKEIQNRVQSKRKEKMDTIREKMRVTNLKRYGTEYVLQNEDIRAKIEKTNIERYGSKSILGNKEFRAKYGIENNFKGNFLDSIKKDNIKKYGVFYNSQRDDVKAKKKATNLKRYGRTNGKGFGSEFIDIDANQKKIYETKKANNTFHISHPEDYAKKMLIFLFGNDVDCQYKSDLYPFACDFYIRSLDLYIELNYHWSHGLKCFEGTEEDNAKVDKWRNKNTKYYSEAIKTWTERDVLKLKAFKDNNLNYRIVYKESEFNDLLHELDVLKIEQFGKIDVFNICTSTAFPGSYKYGADHPIWNCRVGADNVSPKEAWNIDSYLIKAINNLFTVYKNSKSNNEYPLFTNRVENIFRRGNYDEIAKLVLTRFTIAKIAPKVTALSSNTMLNILKETNIDLSQYGGVYVPMAGFGGIVEAINMYASLSDMDIDIEAYDINDAFCNYYGWTKRDVLETTIETDKIVIACPPFGKQYENWNEKSSLEPDTMYSFREWCDKIREHVKAPNYIFIGPSDRNEEREGKQPGLFAKKVGVKWYKEYTK